MSERVTVPTGGAILLVKLRHGLLDSVSQWESQCQPSRVTPQATPSAVHLLPKTSL